MGNCCSRLCDNRKKKSYLDESKKQEELDEFDEASKPNNGNVQESAEDNFTPLIKTNNSPENELKEEITQEPPTDNKQKRKKKQKKRQSSEDDTSESTSSSASDSTKHRNHGYQKVTINKISDVQFAAIGKNAQYIDQRVYTNSNDNQNKSNTKKKKSAASEDNSQFLKKTDEGGYMKHLDQIVEAGQSVGMIYCEEECGTGFRVGSKYIMTAYHIVRRIIDPRKSGNPDQQRLAKDGVCIIFKYKSKRDLFQPHSFKFEPTIPYFNEELDTAILVLKKEQIDFPKAILNFDEIDDKQEIYLIGHPDGKPMKYDPKIEIWHPDKKMMDSAQKWSEKNYHMNGYEGIDDSRKVLFHTSFQHGASGAPAVMLTNHDEVTVVLMLLRGYPTFYYSDFKEDDQKEFRKTQGQDYLIEQGISIKSVWNQMKNIPQFSALCEDIFPNRCFND